MVSACRCALSEIVDRVACQILRNVDLERMRCEDTIPWAIGVDRSIHNFNGTGSTSGLVLGLQEKTMEKKAAKVIQCLSGCALLITGRRHSQVGV